MNMPSMEGLNKTGRSFYGICIATLGIHQLWYADFRTVILPPWPAWRTSPGIWAYLAGAALIVAGLAIIFEKKARVVALILGTVLLALIVFWQVPYMLFVFPNHLYHLGVWADATKELALSGGAFVVAGSTPDKRPNTENKPSIERLLIEIIPLGRIFFSIMLITFGIDHFLYVESVATLVPAWIPGHHFWAYFAGVALIGSGTAIILKFKLKGTAILLGTMIFLWFVLLHIPRAIADPIVRKGNEVASAADALGFSGIAFVLASGIVRPREKPKIG
jgi:uncharacterized membrane protein